MQFKSVFKLALLGLWTVFIVPIAQAPATKLAEKMGLDQYYIASWEPALSTLAKFGQDPWVIFFAGFFTGVLVFAGANTFVRGRPSGRQHSDSQITASQIAHMLSPVGGSAVLLGIDRKKKTTEIGFQLQNTSGMPLRWAIVDFATSIDSHHSANIAGKGGSGVASLSGLQKWYGGVISYVPPVKKEAKATAKIVYQYGAATPDTPMLREAVFAVEIDIHPNGNFRYNVLEENDAEI